MGVIDYFKFATPIIRKVALYLHPDIGNVEKEGSISSQSPVSISSAYRHSNLQRPASRFCERIPKLKKKTRIIKSN